MPDWLWIVIVVAIVLIVAAGVVALVVRRRRTERLRSRFGSEYDRQVHERGGRRRTEAHLQEVAERHDRLEIRPLDATARVRYLERWQEVQGRFVDQPGAALDSADALVADVMRDRGYPVDDFDTQADMVALDHPDVVRRYRSGHDVYVRARQGEASTEDVRQAMIEYRALFEALVADGAATSPSGGESGRA
jgi:hypothetical protein